MRPGDERELARILAEATSTSTPLEIMGSGTKAAIGRPMQTAANLSAKAMRGITLYEPTELVMSARAGTTLAIVERELYDRRQMLAFEPIDLAPLVGGEPRQASIGAVFATNSSGSRRISAGAARDHLLGVRAVTGAGEIFKSGGRVMKNVTGYDLCRGIAGSWGTLAVMTEVTFKVLPMPEETRTLIFLGLPDEIAVEIMCTAMGSPYEVTGAVHLQQPLAMRLWHAGLNATRRSVTALRLEYFSSSIGYRSGKLKEMLAAYGEAEELDQEGSLSFWDELRQLSYLQESSRPVWRISTGPREAPRIVQAISAYMECAAVYDWSGGLVWAEVLPAADAGASDIRRVIATHGGHATLIRAEPAVRASIDVFQPLDPGLEALTRRLKTTFDPAGILNPGRMYASM
ncbi:MAG: FAD-binding protein [Hyphomicrobiaceae bacterium]|nr:FAD-binding protein [Hyphomicrobiaceae bacterium]